jgi:MFS family permease
MRRKLFYGWYITIALAITETVSWGVVFYALEIFIIPMEQEFGWTRTQIAAIRSIAIFLSGVMAFPVGYWLDKYGSRFLMTTGSILATLLVFAWAFADTLTEMYMIWICMGIVMATILYEPSFVVVANWFVKRRGLALAIVTFAAGFASTIFLPLTEYLYQQYGRQGAIVILGFILAAITIPLHAFVLRRRPQDMGLLPDGEKPLDSSIPINDIKSPGMALGQVLGLRSFWWLTVAFTLASTAIYGLRFHLIPYVTEQGYEPGVAAGVVGMVGAMQVLGRVIFAPLEMRFSVRVLVTVIMLLQTLTIGLLLIHSLPMLIIFVVTFGATVGAATLARPALLATFYGPAQYGRISSVIAFFVIMGLTTGPILVSFIYEQFDSYSPALWVLIIISALSLLSVIGIQQPKEAIDDSLAANISSTKA